MVNGFLCTPTPALALPTCHSHMGETYVSGLHNLQKQVLSLGYFLHLILRTKEKNSPIVSIVKHLSSWFSIVKVYPTYLYVTCGPIHKTSKKSKTSFPYGWRPFGPTHPMNSIPSLYKNRVLTKGNSHGLSAFKLEFHKEDEFHTRGPRKTWDTLMGLKVEGQINWEMPRNFLPSLCISLRNFRLKLRLCM